MINYPRYLFVLSNYNIIILIHISIIKHLNKITFKYNGMQNCNLVLVLLKIPTLLSVFKPQFSIRSHTLKQLFICIASFWLHKKKKSIQGRSFWWTKGNKNEVYSFRDNFVPVCNVPQRKQPFIFSLAVWFIIEKFYQNVIIFLLGYSSLMKGQMFWIF